MDHYHDPRAAWATRHIWIIPGTMYLTTISTNNQFLISRHIFPNDYPEKYLYVKSSLTYMSKVLDICLDAKHTGGIQREASQNQLYKNLEKPGFFHIFQVKLLQTTDFIFLCVPSSEFKMNQKGITWKHFIKQTAQRPEVTGDGEVSTPQNFWRCICKRS